MVKGQFVLLVFLGYILFVDAKVASSSGGLERRRHHGHHHKHHHHERAASVTGATPSSNDAKSSPETLTSSPDHPLTEPAANTTTSAGSDLRGAPYTPPPGGFPASAPRTGGVNVKDVCFGFSSDSIGKGLAEMNRLRQKYTTEVDKIPRPGVYWNSDLALEAYKTASACKWQHGDTPGLGQNMNSAGPERNLTDSVVMWWSEEAAFKEQGPDGPDGGHVGAALWDQVTAMGCGIADCSHTSAGYWIAACNMNNYANNKTYPAQPTPHCPEQGVVVPYHRAN